MDNKLKQIKYNFNAYALFVYYVLYTHQAIMVHL